MSGIFNIAIGKRNKKGNKALVIDPVKGWGLEHLEDTDIAGKQKRNFEGHWLPLVIREYDANGEVTGYREPVLVTDIVSPPGRLYRGLNSFMPLVPMLWSTRNPWLDRLKIGLYILVFVVMLVVLLLFWGSVTGTGG